MKLTQAKITLPIGKKISNGQGLCLTKNAPNKGRLEHHCEPPTIIHVVTNATRRNISINLSIKSRYNDYF